MLLTLVLATGQKLQHCQRWLGTGAAQNSLKHIPEQTELQTAPDSPQLPVSIREDREAFSPSVTP